MPNFLDNKLPGKENPTSPDIASHVSALHAARRAFIPSESSNKLKIGISENIRKSGAVFNIGGEVFYKRDEKLAWKWSGQFLGQNGPAVYIQHGLHYIRAHSCCIQLTNPGLDNNSLSQTSNVIPLAQTNALPSPDIPKPRPLTDLQLTLAIMTLILDMKTLQMNIEMITSQMNIKRKIVLLSMKMEVLPRTKTLF